MQPRLLLPLLFLMKLSSALELDGITTLGPLDEADEVTTMVSDLDDDNEIDIKAYITENEGNGLESNVTLTPSAINATEKQNIETAIFSDIHQGKQVKELIYETSQNDIDILLPNDTSKEKYIHNDVSKKHENNSVSDVIKVTNNSYNYNEKLKILEYISKTNIHKCMCKSNELYYMGECVEEETFVLVLEDQNMWAESKYRTSDFRNVSVQNLECSDKKLKLNLTFNEFYLLPNGFILYDEYNLIFDQKNSCIEHSRDESGGQTWGAQVCLPPPTVNFCCKKAKCSSGKYKPAYFPMVVVDGTEDTWPYLPRDYLKIKCNDNEMLLRYKLDQDNYLLYTSQGIVLVLDMYDTLIYPQEFCIQTVRNKELATNFFEARFCAINTQKIRKENCESNLCIRKCCPENQVFDLQANICNESKPEHQWKIEIHNNETLKPDLGEIEYVLDVGFPQCKRHFYSLDPSSGEKFLLLDNGSLYVDTYKDSISPLEFCIDNTLDVDYSQTTAFVCFPDLPKPVNHCQKVQKNLYPSLLIVSCLFLAATLFVYSAIVELHAKVHGKSLVSHVFSLLVAYLCLVIVQWASDLLSMPLCIAMGMLTQISFLSAFFWLNVMCWDIWWTLRSMKPVDDVGESSRQRFTRYSIYAWGCPILISIVTNVIEHLPSHLSDNLIRPGFGVSKCWFKDNTALWAYFYGFVLILTISNIFFFCQVAFILIQAQRANDVILRTSSKQHKERVWLYLKLFVVMGVTWICEVVSWQEGTCEPWLIPDIINALQGLFIFLIFICKKNVYQKIILQIRSKSGPKILHVKKLVRGSSSYTSSQTSQRTTQTDISQRKLSAPLSSKTPMTVIAEDEGPTTSRHGTNVRSRVSTQAATHRKITPTQSTPIQSSSSQSTPILSLTPQSNSQYRELPLHRKLSPVRSSPAQSHPCLGGGSTVQPQIETISGKVEEVTISGPSTTIVEK